MKVIGHVQDAVDTIQLKTLKNTVQTAGWMIADLQKNKTFEGIVTL
jgi:SepF-like predicted cell division protein (DUF552 family)